MVAEAPTAATGRKQPPPSLPLTPALFLVRARSRASRVADLGDTGAAAWPSGPPDTPPRRSPVTVPFLWEEAPGKPKAPQQQQGDGGTGAPTAPAGPVVPSDVSVAAAAAAPATGAGDNDNGGGDAKAPRPAPLKLPPRLQRVASAKQRDDSLSPRTVLHGPHHYYGCAGGGRRPPRRTASGFAVFRRTPSAGVGLFSRNKTTAAGTKRNSGGGGGHDHLGAGAPDAPWCSPAASSASSSSSSSLSASCFGDDPGRRRPADGREDGSSEEDECAGGSVRITRFTRNRSLPSMTTTSHLWASIRKSFKQITPWS